jgi:hypothetical protein
VGKENRRESGKRKWEVKWKEKVRKENRARQWREKVGVRREEKKWGEKVERKVGRGE